MATPLQLNSTVVRHSGNISSTDSPLYIIRPWTVPISRRIENVIRPLNTAPELSECQKAKNKDSKGASPELSVKSPPPV